MGRVAIVTGGTRGIGKAICEHLSEDGFTVVANYAGNSEAASLAKRAYELVPENAAIADTYGWILFEAGEHEQSLAVLERAHSLAPDSQEIAMHLAEAYRATGRTDAAQQIMDKFSTGNNG